MIRHIQNCIATKTLRSLNVSFMTIDDYLLGHWSNRYQAQSAPHHFSTVEAVWKKVDGGYYSKNYFRSDGSNKPYRERYHKMVSLSDDEILVENYDLDWTRAEDCDMILKFDGTCWRGELATPGKCTGVKGYRVVSEIYIFKDKLHTMDQGYNSEGKMVWGSEQLYKFTRMGEQLSGRATRLHRVGRGFDPLFAHCRFLL